MRISLGWATLLATTAMVLANCGGGGGDIAAAPAPPPPLHPTPTPTPAPTPTPTSFRPVAATIFSEPFYNRQLAVVGKVWQHDYVPQTAGALNLRDADSFSVVYDPGTRTYQVTAPLLGSGTLVRIDETYQPEPVGSSFAALLAQNAAAAVGQPGSMRVRAADQASSRYTYVSFLDFGADQDIPGEMRTTAYGVIGIAQPTPPGDVPTTGSARYDGHAHGIFAGDAGATWIEGTTRFDFDFGQASLTGDMTLSMRCMMGCSYGSVTYVLADTQFARGSTIFSGNLSTSGASGSGSFSGLFAGPGATEMAAGFELPFFNPEYQRWMTAGGVILGKRD